LSNIHERNYWFNNQQANQDKKMDTIWECMNIASRVAKQVELSDNLVPKNQVGVVTPATDLQEFATTVNSVRTTLVPFVTSSKKSKVVSEPPFEVCIKGIRDSLNDIHLFFKDLEKEFSVYTWKTQKVKIYRKDFELKQKLDQFTALFNPEDEKSDKKSKHNPGAALIQDAEGKEMWIKSFGESTMMVPWNVFFSTLEGYLGTSFKEDEEFIKMYLNFTRTDHVSTYELNVWLKMFGPLKGSIQRPMDSLRAGLLCGYVSAVEANLLLEGKKEGTFLVRCSKTQPGSFAVTFVDNVQKVKHCLLYAVTPTGLTLKSPPTVYNSLNEFASAHTNKLKHPLGNKYTLKKGLPGYEFTETTKKEQQSSGPTPENNICVVCMDAPFETVFLECGHMACCQKCSQQLKLCPICRNTISRIVPVFRAN